jgi:hypothetical protein
MKYQSYYTHIQCKIIKKTEKAFLLLIYPENYEIWMPKALVRNYDGFNMEVYEPVYKKNLEKCLREKEKFNFDFGLTKKDVSSLKLDQKLIKNLIMLCHPDKHNNSKIALEITQMLIDKKNKINE